MPRFPPAAPAAAAPSNVNAVESIFEIMAEKTGYDTDMISEEMDLETDLGIDSIKRVEILSAVVCPVMSVSGVAYPGLRFLGLRFFSMI